MQIKKGPLEKEIKPMIQKNTSSELPNVKAIIMAGGEGKRLWPRSNATTPKQFLALLSNKPLIWETYERLNEKNTIAKNNIFFAVGKTHLHLLKKSFPDAKNKTAQDTSLATLQNTIVEPQAKDTAAAIALTALHLTKQKKTEESDVLFFLPADATITNVPAFHKAISKASTLAAKGSSIVLLGIKPTRPATEFGYLETVESSSKSHFNNNAHSVKRFVEKPTLARAKIYIKKRNYLWNSGMFFMTTKFLVDVFRQHAPQHLEQIDAYLSLMKSKKNKAALEAFSKLKKVSFDYAIAEKLGGQIHAIEADIGWDDLGGYDALKRRQSADSNNNKVSPRTVRLKPKLTDESTVMQSNISREKSGKAVFYNSSGNYVDSNKNVILSGVENLTVVVENDTIFISSDKGQKSVKQLLTYIQSLDSKNSKLL